MSLLENIASMSGVLEGAIAENSNNLIFTGVLVAIIAVFIVSQIVDIQYRKALFTPAI